MHQLIFCTIQFTLCWVGVKPAFVLLASANIIYAFVEDAMKIEDLFEFCLLNWKEYNIDYTEMLSMRYHQKAPRACGFTHIDSYSYKNFA